MNVLRPAIFWIAILATIVAMVVVLRDILLPFLAAMALAYLLNPLAGKIERLGTSRLLATLVITFSFFIGLILLLVITLPILVREFAYFVDSLPGYVRQLHKLATDSDLPWVSKVFGEGLAEAERSVSNFATVASEWLGAVLRSVWSDGRSLISMFSLVVVTPIVACYLLSNWDEMIATVDNWVPTAQRGIVRSLARQIDDTIGGFVRGQGALCLILAVFYAVALSLIGLRHGALIGFSAGLMSFIPYVGSLLGLVISACIATAQFWPHWAWIAVVPAVFLVGQSLADYVLAPYLVARRVHLHPVWVIFALFAFGSLFGFVGLVIAVPSAAAIGVLTRFAFRRYYASSLYEQGSSIAK
jgi:predicted PurR-regulated permease PerM